ncbi:hypothetical protein D9Q98_007610 [Chlorella vulgaris]|uniref:tRNA threonylcarbamoyladenosine biosynthesis protein TsaE n=1 Tax=Chlorella vulgaris TaxID=3077 RepID=A0A9D4TLF5_CHLVU|nr:hypothetical protein D9Q98_007610 [Chlorella vulgaris]
MLTTAAHHPGEAQAMQEQPAPSRMSVLAASPAATQAIANFFAQQLHAADCYLLYGSVGAGKSYFSRAFIRAAADDDELPVPSPTFLLQNIYNEHPGPPIHHFDLYRLTQQYDLARLDLQSSFTQAVCLVEWPQRMGLQHLPQEHLALHISILSPAEQQQAQQQLAAAESSAVGSVDLGCQQGEPGGGAEEDAVDGSSIDDGSGDARWRRMWLTPMGKRWLPRLQLLQRALEQQGAQLGCHLEQRLSQ